MFKVSEFFRFFILNSQLSSEKELACRKMNHSSVSKLRGDMSVVGDFVKELCSSRKMSKFNSQRFKYLSFQSPISPPPPPAPLRKDSVNSTSAGVKKPALSCT